MSKPAFADLWAWTEERAHVRVFAALSQKIYFRAEDLLQSTIDSEWVSQAFGQIHRKMGEDSWQGQ